MQAGQGARRHHGGGGERGLSDRLRAAGARDRADHGAGGADPHRRGGVAYHGAGPAPRGGPAGPVDLGAPEAAQRRGQGQGVGDHRGAGRVWPRPPRRGGRVLVNARAAPAPPGGQAASGRLVAAVAELDTILDRAGRVIAQTRIPAGRGDAGLGDPAGVAARPGRPPDRQGPARASRWSSATRPRSSTTPTGSCSTTACTRATRPTRRCWPRRSPGSTRCSAGRRGAVTADRGYGEAKIEQTSPTSA